MPYPPRYQQIILLAALLLPLATSCQRRRQPDYASLDLARVSGQVTLDGQPLEEATVIFEDPEGRRSYGTTDRRGRYELRYNSEQLGVPAGPKSVRIQLHAPAEGEEPESDGTEGEELDHVPPEPVPARYNRQSELSVVVEAGKSQTFDFPLLTTAP